MFAKNKNGCFDCDRCPMTNDRNQPRHCVMWWELIMSNPSGESKVEKGCGFQMLPGILVETLKSADHSAAAAYDMRNKVTESVGKFLSQAGDLIGHTEPEQLEKKEDEDEVK